MMSELPSGSIRLSFCIPTYNRGSFIGETIESIVSQATEDVEIVIVDGGSTDDTNEVVERFRQRFSNINYCRQQTNMGVDHDMATSVSLARGAYCWLTSSDDPIAPGAIKKIMTELQSGCDMYLCNINLCSKSLKPFESSAFLSDSRTTDIFELGKREELLRYFSEATSNNALFCYMGSIIFRRDRWLHIGFNEEFSGTGYAHVYSLFAMAKEDAKLKYIEDGLVMNRADNDCFSAGGIEKRYLLDFNGYLKLADALWADDSEVRKAFLQVMKREHKWYRLIKLRVNISKQSWQSFSTLLPKFGYGRRLLSFVNFCGYFRLPVKIAVYLRPKIRRTTSIRWYLSYTPSKSYADKQACHRTQKNKLGRSD